MTDPFNLDRFVAAQESVYSTVKNELIQGDKRSHWMWFIFPQIEGLGSSPTAAEFAISGIEEAKEYLLHPILGARLKECTKLVLNVKGRSLNQIFGFPDDLKFRSSMTLFAAACGGDDVFDRALIKYCEGQKDPKTQRLLD